MRLTVFLLSLILLHTACKSKTGKEINSITGHYSGYFEYKTKKLSTSIDLSVSSGKLTASISIPDNLLLNKAFTTINYKFPNLTLGLADGEQLLLIKSIVTNKFLEGEIDGKIPATLLLNKIGNYKIPEKNYSTETLALHNNGVDLPAKLYLPKTHHPTAAIIMVCGTGTHTKEEYNGAADMFASKGIATLVFDKRNVTRLPALKLKQVNSDIAFMKDLVSDVASAFDLLKTRKEIDPKKIGLIGFSLGAVEVPVVASMHPDIAFVIAVSGNATTDKEFIINQGLNKLKDNNYKEPVLSKVTDLYEHLFAYARNRTNAKDLQQELDKAYSEGWGKYCFVKEVPSENELKYLMNWNNFEFDPAIYWQKIQVPTLVIYGTQDKLIPVTRSIDILNKVFANKKELLTLKLYANADHTIRTIPQEADFDFPRYADHYIDDMLQWIATQTK